VSGDLEGFASLSSDEPLDLAAIRADDTMLDHIGSGGRSKHGDELEQLLAAFAASAQAEPAPLAERVHVVLTPPEAWPPRIDPTYRAWRDAAFPTEPIVDTFVIRAVCMAVFLACALIAVVWAALP
jgi:hypothetical protein